MPDYTDARAELAKIDEHWAKARWERRKALNHEAVVVACPLFVNATCAEHSGPSDRDRLTAQYLHLVSEGAQIQRRADKTTDALMGVTLILLLSAMAGLVFAVAQIFGLRAIILLGVMSLAAGVVVLAFLIPLLEKVGIKVSFGVLLAIDLVVIVVSWWFFVQNPILSTGGSYARTPLGSLTVLGVALGAFLIIGIVLSTIHVKVEKVLWAMAVRGRRRSAAFHAAAVAFMAMADRGDGHKGMPAIGTLSRIAHHLWRMDGRRRLPDRDLRAAVADRFHQASNAVRATKLWVALPNADTHAELQRFLVRLMRTLLDEHYDDLPLAPPITPIVRRRAVVSFLRTVTVGILPLAVLLVLPLLDVDLAKLAGTNVADSARAVAVGWAAVTLLLLLDPNLRERLAVLKDAKGLFRGE